MAAQNECAKLEATLAVSTAALDSAVGAQRASAEKLSAAFNALRDERSRCQSLMAEQSSWQVSGVIRQTVRAAASQRPLLEPLFWGRTTTL